MTQKNEFNELFKKVALKNTSKRRNHVAADASISFLFMPE